MDCVDPVLRGADPVTAVEVATAALRYLVDKGHKARHEDCRCSDVADLHKTIEATLSPEQIRQVSR